MHPTLTTVAQDVEQIAGLAIERLILEIQGETLPAQNANVAMRLVIRNSTTKQNSKTKPEILQ